jgi:hypothetical protein
MKKRIVSFAVALVLPVMLSSPAFAVAFNTGQSGQLHVNGHSRFLLGRHRHNKVAGTTAYTASNWSGYAVTGNNGAFNAVSSSWTQPSLDCNALPTDAYSSYWVGLDGFSDSTVEQIGTEADCVNGAAQYNAWYEMYPSNPYELSVRLTVHPGDKMTASVNYQPATQTTVLRHGRVRTTKTIASYVLALKDATTNKSYSVTLSPRKSFNRSSAEVIAEAPSSYYGILPLADFGTVNFTDSLVNGLAMGGLPNLAGIIMQNPAGMVATPSPFDPNNEDFSVGWSAS